MVSIGMKNINSNQDQNIKSTDLMFGVPNRRQKIINRVENASE